MRGEVSKSLSLYYASFTRPHVYIYEYSKQVRHEKGKVYRKTYYQFSKLNKKKKTCMGLLLPLSCKINTQHTKKKKILFNFQKLCFSEQN